VFPDIVLRIGIEDIALLAGVPPFAERTRKGMLPVDERGDEDRS
jgi:hypothetical protein